MVKGFAGFTFWVWSQGGCKLQKFVIDSYRVKISLCVPWPTPIGSNFAFFCSFRNQSFARWQFMMNIYNIFPWEVCVKIGHLGPSILPLNSQVGNSNSKKKIRKLPLQQFFPIKMDFFWNIQKSWKQEESITKSCYFPSSQIHFRKRQLPLSQLNKIQEHDMSDRVVEK